MIHDFWINDGVLMTAWSRAVVYGGLFVLALLAPWVKGPHGDSPIYAKALFLHTNQYYVHEVNRFTRAFRFLHNERAIGRITRVVLVTWVFCIIGFGGFASRLVCGLGILLLATMIYGFKKLNGHRWWVASFVIFFMAFTDCFADASMDAWMAQRFSTYPVLEPDWNVLSSGFASKLILFIAAYTLVAGGVAKIRNGGLRWLRSDSFFFYIGDPKHTRLPRFVGWLQRHPVAVTTLAAGSVMLEVGSIVPLFVAEVRVPWVFLAIGFHIAIWLLMSPKYFPQCVSYLAVIVGARIGDDVAPVAGDLSTTIAVVLAMGFAAIHVYALVIRYEGWPLTHIPMYSYDRSSFSHEALTRPNLEHLVNQVGGLLKISKPTISIPSDLADIDVSISDQTQKELATTDHGQPRLSAKSSGGGGLFSTNWFLLTSPNSPTVDVTRELCFYFCAETTYFRRRLLAAIMRYYDRGEEADVLSFLRLSLYLLRKIPRHRHTEVLNLVVPMSGELVPIATVQVEGQDISGKIAPGWRTDAHQLTQ